MATTRLMTRHTGSGMTIMETLKDGFDYGKNPDKTRNGDLILDYECDPATADAEFLLSKAKYKAITGREQKRENDVLYYQIRQSFPPGETDPETALKISYDLAMRWTKGRHAFFVVAKYSNKYLAEHEADIAAYRAAQDTFRRLLSGSKLPKMDTLKSEFQRLSADKKNAYREYRETKKAMQEIVTVKSNIDHLLGLTDAQKNKEMER